LILLCLMLIAFLGNGYNYVPKCRDSKIKVAIVDTGLDLNDKRFEGHICATGHKNFSIDYSINDFMGHGTHVAGLIRKFAGEGEWCLLIYKTYSNSVPGPQNVENYYEGMLEAIRQGATIINYSAGGPVFNTMEYNLIKDNPDVTFVVAAGNDGVNIDEDQNQYFPASYWLPNEVVVTGIGHYGRPYKSSNYSKVHKTVAELGENVLSFMPNGKYAYLSGTSMSTAIHTGKMVREMLSGCE
jgi:major intracellular serine protease